MKSVKYTVSSSQNKNFCSIFITADQTYRSQTFITSKCLFRNEHSLINMWTHGRRLINTELLLRHTQFLQCSFPCFIIILCYKERTATCKNRFHQCDLYTDFTALSTPTHKLIVIYTLYSCSESQPTVRLWMYSTECGHPITSFNTMPLCLLWFAHRKIC